MSADDPGLPDAGTVLGAAVAWWPGGVLLGAALTAAALGATVVTAVLMLGGAQAPAPSATQSAQQVYGVSAFARADVPPTYLDLYQAAAARYGLDWAVLAGIGKVECDHGRDPAPACTQEGATNSAGAGGPAQFLASTWAVYGVAVNGDGPPDRWDPADAIFSMANYLRAAGAPQDYDRAIYAYNHAGWYVAEVLHWAALYRGPPLGQSAGSALAGAPLAYVRGDVARLDPRDGHIGLAPVGAPAAVQAMIAAGNALQDLPYGPAGHPDPRNAPSEDCSSTVNYVLWRGGVRSIADILATNPLAQSYVGWGDPGPGRWVTIYATTEPTDHVFIVIAGLRLDTSHNGTDIGPNRYQNGPRWRILPYIPTWAHWSVRHPPGL